MLLKERKLQALAVSTSKRARALPEVPTTTELGLKDSAFDLWIGLFAPAGTPTAVVERLHAEGRKAIETPVVQDRLSALAMEGMPMGPSEFAAYFKKDIEDIADLVKRAGIRAE